MQLPTLTSKMAVADHVARCPPPTGLDPLVSLRRVGSFSTVPQKYLSAFAATMSYERMCKLETADMTSAWKSA